MPPTHFDGGNVNMFQPYEVGQSGTDRPDPVLVTRLPASTRNTVQPATAGILWCTLAKQVGVRGWSGGPASGETPPPFCLSHLSDPPVKRQLVAAAGALNTNAMVSPSRRS